MKMKPENENEQQRYSRIGTVCSVAAILMLSAVALFSVFGNGIAKGLTPAGISVGLCMTAVGASLRSRQNETKGEQENEKRN